MSFYFVINKRKWDRLSPDIQKVFTEVAMEAKDKQAALWNEMEIEGRELFKEQGGQILDISEGEIARWIKAVEPVIAGYKQSMVSKGHKESDIDGWISFIKERIDYWKGEEKKRGIPSPYSY